MMLKIKDLHAYYGAIEALKGINLEVPDGEIRCIIGSNGAGKSTTLKSISRIIKTTGSITMDGEDLTTLSSSKIAKRGIIHVPEGRHIFPGLTVYQNLEVGTVPWHGFFGRQSYEEDMQKVFQIFPRLEERKDQKGWSLSGGEQQMLAIGRALMARPKLLLLDEPSMGLAPLVVEELFQQIVAINKEQGVPILLIEQNAKLALKVSNYAYIMEHGKITIEGPASELTHDSRVLEAYLGKFTKKQRGSAHET